MNGKFEKEVRENLLKKSFLKKKYFFDLEGKWKR